MMFKSVNILKRKLLDLSQNFRYFYRNQYTFCFTVGHLLVCFALLSTSFTTSSKVYKNYISTYHSLVSLLVQKYHTSNTLPPFLSPRNQNITKTIHCISIYCTFM